MKALMITLLVAFVYLGVANAVFALRHPWATQTERLMNLDVAVRFGKIDYKETRADYK